METKTAEVIKVYKLKEGKKGEIFTRIGFKFDDGAWAKTDICHSFRNYIRWKKVIESGSGIRVSGLIMRTPAEVDGDSYPVIL